MGLPSLAMRMTPENSSALAIRSPYSLTAATSSASSLLRGPDRAILPALVHGLDADAQEPERLVGLELEVHADGRAVRRPGEDAHEGAPGLDDLPELEGPQHLPHLLVALEPGFDGRLPERFLRHPAGQEVPHGGVAGVEGLEVSLDVMACGRIGKGGRGLLGQPGDGQGRECDRYPNELVLHASILLALNTVLNGQNASAPHTVAEIKGSGLNFSTFCRKLKSRSLTPLAGPGRASPLVDLLGLERGVQDAEPGRQDLVSIAEDGPRVRPFRTSGGRSRRRSPK